MEHPHHVVEWLKVLSVDQSDASKNATGPVTPRRHSSVLKNTNDPSPVKSISSGQSIFSTPVRKTSQLDTPARGYFRDELSDITSTDENDATQTTTSNKRIPAVHTHTQQEQPRTPPANLVFYNSLLSIAPDPPEHKPNHGSNPNPNHPLPTPRIVIILSCFQCTLARLPCSRTVPSCTRCTRNGYAETCLLTRRPFPEETKGLSRAHGMEGKRLVLLKLWGADEQAWQRKGEVWERLVEEWRADCEKKNWVLPRWGERVSERRERWSWEGWGRRAYERLCVVEEVGRDADENEGGDGSGGGGIRF